MTAVVDVLLTYDVDWWTGFVLLIGTAAAGRLVGKHLVAHVQWFWHDRKQS